MPIDLNKQIADLLAKVPVAQRPAAAELVAQYGPRLFQMAQADAWAFIRRLVAGDLTVITELDLKLSDDEFIAKVKANTARWENVAAYNKVRADMLNEFLLRAGPIVLSILLGLVGL